MLYPPSREIDTHFSKTMKGLMWQESLGYLQQQQIERLSWPPKSSDLNSIHLWDKLELCLRSRGRYYFKLNILKSYKAIRKLSRVLERRHGTLYINRN